MTSKLTNPNQVQVVALRLDKSKSRERAFREYLDQNELDGINRKEAILRMFEVIVGDDIKPINKPKHTNKDGQINRVKIDGSNVSMEDLNAVL